MTTNTKILIISFVLITLICTVLMFFAGAGIFAAQIFSVASSSTATTAPDLAEPAPSPSPIYTPRPTATPILVATFTPTPSATPTETNTPSPLPEPSSPTPSPIPPTDTSVALPTNTLPPLPSNTPVPTDTPPPAFSFSILENDTFDTNHLNFDIYVAVVDKNNTPLSGYRLIGQHESGLQVESQPSADRWTQNSGAMHYKAGNIKYEVFNAPGGQWQLQLVDGSNQPVAPPVSYNFSPQNPTWHFLIFQRQ